MERLETTVYFIYSLHVVSIWTVLLWQILLRGNHVRPFTKDKTHTAASAHNVRSCSSRTHSCDSETSPRVKFNILVCIICYTCLHVKNQFYQLFCSLHSLACHLGRWLNRIPGCGKKNQTGPAPGNQSWKPVSTGIVKKGIEVGCRRKKRICWILVKGMLRWAVLVWSILCSLTEGSGLS